MKLKLFFWSYLIVVTLLVSSCFNLFEVLGPNVGGVQNENNVDVLIALGEAEIYNLNYSNAYVAYTRALEIDPNNAKALEGVCTAYIFWKLPMTNLIQVIVSQDFSAGGVIGTLYDIARFVSPRLGKIAFGLSDNAISSNDINIGMHFYIFNIIQTIFGIIDFDGDGVYLNDSDDMFTFTNLNPIGYADNFGSVSNNFGKTMAMIKKLPDKLTSFFSNMDAGDVVMSNIQKIIKSDGVRSTLDSLTSAVGGMRQMLNEQMSNFNLVDSTLDELSFSNILVMIGMEGMAATPNVALTNFLGDSGVTNIGDFYTMMFDAGFDTNGMTPADMVTNIFPDMGSDYASLNTSLNAHFGI